MNSWTGRVATMLRQFCLPLARYRSRRARGLRRRRRQRRGRPRAGSRSGRARFPDRVHQGTAVRRGRRPAGADGPARRAALQRRHRSLYARSRVAHGGRAQHHVPRDQGVGRRQGVEISVDGKKMLFAMRGPVDEGLDLDDPDQPNWGIWEYTIATDTLAALDYRPTSRSRQATTSRRTTCRTAGSSSRRRASVRRRRSCSTRTSRSSRRSTKTATSPHICCTS